MLGQCVYFMLVFLFRVDIIIITLYVYYYECVLQGLIYLNVFVYYMCLFDFVCSLLLLCLFLCFVCFCDVFLLFFLRFLCLSFFLFLAPGSFRKLPEGSGSFRVFLWKKHLNTPKNHPEASGSSRMLKNTKNT